MAGKFVITKNKKGDYHFNLMAANGKIIASSEMYPDKKSAMKGIESIIKNAPTAKIVDDTGEQAAEKKAVKAKAPAEKEKAAKVKVPAEKEKAPPKAKK
ncbi:MAG: DUF1508 domain-containing protein [Treponema sp.]|jgi:uncharacterized protein YegP (UPF0339 family)|nr:DUF1508 domain-containing protein [Treponema sp.]